MDDGEVFDIFEIAPIIRYGYDKFYYRKLSSLCGEGSVDGDSL
jgi:hypothetical protein